MSDDFNDEDDQSEKSRFDKERGRRRYDDWRERSNVVTIFRELGYNLHDGSDMDRLRENLRFADQGRKREELLRTRWFGWALSIVIAIVGAVLTTLGTWIAGHIK